MVTIRKPKGRLRELETERYILSTLPVLWLPLYRKDGSSFISADGYGHLATVTGATWGLQGRTFDGTDDGINVGNIDITGGITVLGWIKADLTDSAVIAAKDDVDLNRIWVCHFGSNKPSAELFTPYVPLSGNTAVSAGTWAMIGFSNDLANLRVYLNGLQDGSTARTAGQASSTLAVQVGKKTAASTTFDGVIGEVLIYNRALSSAEIQRNYLATKWRYQ